MRVQTLSDFLQQMGRPRNYAVLHFEHDVVHLVRGRRRPVLRWPRNLWRRADPSPNANAEGQQLDADIHVRGMCPIRQHSAVLPPGREQSQGHGQIGKAVHTLSAILTKRVYVQCQPSVKVKPKKQKLKDFAPEKVVVKDDFDKALIIGSKEWVARKHVEEKRAAQAKGDETGPNHKPPASLSLAVNFYEKKTIQKNH